ncbi:cupin [Thioalkalivibrio denitrificans]|uniref:Cupin n=2 Tax=Thioalkalivibrio denitrificans TaxID=108003 RepID=A0A1V3N6H7_9GAMM|nr:cupin [Thioalkalivibrio denitrificans]
MTLLGGLTPARFLRDYWQQRPLLVRQALPGFESPLSPEELAGLACEETVISRLVKEHVAEGGWAVRHGPFDEADFTGLPETHWTLLVSDLEKHLPELRRYLEPFRFIHDWRMDDLMVSYAVPGGSVGPHVDQYDVFLLQAHGRRRWQIDTRPVAGDNFLPDQTLRILRSFDPEEDWVLEPGDMLYLPPQIAHHGVAEGPCMTWSIGFRAPAWRDLLAAWVDERYAAMSGDARYEDPARPPATDPGEIPPADLAQLISGMREAMSADDRELGRWLGRHLTEPKGELLDIMKLPESMSPDAASQVLDGASRLERHGAARLAWIGGLQCVHLYVNGREHTLPPESAVLVRLLCGALDYDAQALQSAAAPVPGGAELLLELCAAGVLLPVAGDER